jgi:hypothetical protein
MSLPGSAAGAPGLSSIAWSHGRDGGNSCEASSEKTLENEQYWLGMFGFSDVCVGSVTSLQMYMVSARAALILLICRGINRARAASGVLSMTGSWLWSIQPLFQSIHGWKAVNQGYPKMTLFSPRLERKNRRVCRCAPVCVCRSVKYKSSPLLFGVPSTLNSFLGSLRRYMGTRRYLA